MSKETKIVQKTMVSRGDRNDEMSRNGNAPVTVASVGKGMNGSAPAVAKPSPSPAAPPPKQK
jgi:hypothetical protein